MTLASITAEQKEAWIADLQSGKYRHGKKRLKTVYNDDLVTEHCCLGVLCETLGKEILLARGSSIASRADFNRIDVDNKETGYEFFEEFLGIPSTQVSVLYSINDAADTVDYKQQVDWIRKNIVPK